MPSDNIKIKAKKISEINRIDDESFSLNEYGDTSYLLLSYKDNSSVAQNFRMSLNQLANQILSQPGTLSDQDFYNQLNRLIQTNPELKESLSGKAGESAFEIARRLGLTAATNEEEFIKMIINNANYNYQPDIDNTTTYNYIFTYAPESSDYLIMNNGYPVGIKETLINASWSQKTYGKIPENRNNSNDSFYMKDYNYKSTSAYNASDNNYSFKWNPCVRTGKVWIVVPKHFFDVVTCSFIDNLGHKWQICDALHKDPLEPVAIKEASNVYQSQAYVFFCYSTNGAVGKVYFKKIS